MALTPYVVEQFGGLNLQVDPFEAGPSVATDLLNVDFDRLGRIRTRDGTATWNASTLSSSGYAALYDSPTFSSGVLLGIRYRSGTTIAIDQVTTTGATTNLGTLTAAAGTFPISHTSIGSTTSARTFITFATPPGTGADLIVMAGSGPGPAGAGKPIHVTTSPTSNRLVQAGYFAAADTPSGANGSRSTVYFSDPGAATTYGTNNFVTLHPGDGEVITGMAVWQDLLFVFKQSAAFVFYSESQDGDGNPVFNYRRINLPDPITDPVTGAPFARYIVAGTDGVYFSTSRGIWRTQGGAPQLMSGAVNKAFTRDATVSSAVQSSFSAPAALSWVTGRLIAAYTNVATNVRQLVWDPVTNNWTLWNLPAFLFAEYPAGAITSRDEMYYICGSGDNNVYAMKPANTSDSGSPVNWTWTSGKYALSDPGRVAVTNETSLDGSGTVSVSLTSDLYGAQSGVASLGSSPTIAEGWPPNIDQEGRWIQANLSGSGPASVARMTHTVNFTKPVGVR